MFFVYFLLFSVSLVVSICAIHCLEKLVSEMMKKLQLSAKFYSVISKLITQLNYQIVR